MEVEVNWIAVVLATLSTMIIGSMWYMPQTFGNAWMRLTKIKPSGNAKDAAGPILLTLVVSAVTAYVLAHVIFVMNSFFGNSFLQDALTTAFWLWLGLVAARFITHDAFENRPLQLTAINLAHELVTLEVMALIIGLLGV